MRKSSSTYILLIPFLYLLSSCSITSLVPDDGYLLTKNKIDHADRTKVELGGQSNYLGQKPNRKLGFVRFHLRAYQTGERGLRKGKDTTRWRKVLIDIGEPPVILDSHRCQLGADRLGDYYFSKGFLDSKVNYEVVPLRRKKRAKVIYHVELGKFSNINSISYLTPDSLMDRLVDSTKALAEIKKGDRLDFEEMQKERSRLISLFKNSGYFYFNSTYIDFTVDTASRSDVNVKVNVRENKQGLPHRQQFIEEVKVLLGSESRGDTTWVDSIMLIEGSYFINPEVISRQIYFRPGDRYNASKVQKSYANLLGTGLFKFVTIRFSPSKSDSLNRLNAIVVLQTASKHDFIWEPQAITTEQGAGIEASSERNFGIGNNISLRNRNVFGNAEALNINLNTALETQLKADSIRTLSNFRQSVSAELVFPSLLFLNKQRQGLTTPSTRISLSYLYDRNVNYNRHVFPMSYTYNFQYGGITYAVTPLRVSYNRAKVEEDFLSTVPETSKDYITQLLTNNLISGPALGVFWSQQSMSPKKYWSVRANALELSGNLFSAYYQLFTSNRDLNRTVLGVKYSQYVRTEVDLSFHQQVDKNNHLAYRFYGGVGVPYGNTAFLPFERRFFVGGGNSLRAWRPRTIGPGGYVGETQGISIDKTGEVLLQAQAEYRFTMIKSYVNGAVFVDAGNIWLLRPNEQFENGHFSLQNFYRQVAINSGFGLRLDLSYIIFRIDLGVALHDPSYTEGNRWVIGDFGQNAWLQKNTALNFAVGYPF